MNDENGKMFSYQFTLAKLKIYGLKFNILMTAVSDMQTGKHYYAQQSIFFGKNVVITPERVGVDGTAMMTFEDPRLGLDMKGEDYFLKLDIEAAKPRVWHCQDGELRMGIEGPKQKTYYWSYTNLPFSGRLILNGKEHQVTGKGWFDRQGGPYNLLDRRTQWEWFSLRFFDDEEIMLFSFPHVGYQDGTYIEEDGRSSRLTEYKISPLGWTEARGLKFSYGWRLEIPSVKDQAYTIVPKVEGQFNFFYYEMLAEIKKEDGTVVGYCFVELLPGVYNEKNTVSAAFARVK
jgi:predicted secreted hydrolase